MLGPDKNQNEFDDYINNLDVDKFCKYNEPFVGITIFCNLHLTCRFKSKIPLRHRDSERYECNRQNIMKIKKLLG